MWTATIHQGTVIIDEQALDDEAAVDWFNAEERKARSTGYRLTHNVITSDRRACHLAHTYPLLNGRSRTDYLTIAIERQ